MLLSTRLSVFRRFGSSLADVQVILFKDVPELGKRGEIVQVESRYARRTLVPQQLAYYVPREQGIPILPRSWKPTHVKEISFETILPADQQLSEELFLNASTSDKLTLQDAARAEYALSSTSIEKLKSMRDLTLVRKQLSPFYPNIEGTITSQDIANDIFKKLGVQVRSQDIYHVVADTETFDMEQGLKEEPVQIDALGQYPIKVYIEGEDAIKFGLIVERF